MVPQVLPGELTNHQDEWTALTFDNRLVGWGKTPEEALAAAAARGEKDVSLFFASHVFFDGTVLIF